MYSPEESYTAHGSACDHAVCVAASGDRCISGPCISRPRVGALKSITRSPAHYLPAVLVLASAMVLSACAPSMPVKSETATRDQQVDLSNLAAEVADERTIAIHARASLIGALSHDLTNADFAESLVDNILNAQTASVLAIYSPEQRKILMHRDNLRKRSRPTQCIRQ